MTYPPSKASSALLAAATIALLCTSCERTAEVTASPAAPPSALVAVSPTPADSGPQTNAPGHEPVIISYARGELEGARQRGRELLEEYQVQPGQTIRFPYESHIFDCCGDVPVTSLEEARSAHPDWPIPESLGGYDFLDLTLYLDRTTVVFPDTVPKPKAEIAVREAEETWQYYLCYGDAEGRFMINVIPPNEFVSTDELMPSHNPDYQALPDCPTALVVRDSEEDPNSFISMLMTAGPDDGYLFMVRKISGDDCLESKDISFTGEEAQAIYASIHDGFDPDPQS